MSAVLGIVGSPRRNGNTEILVRTILDGAQQAGATTDLLFLADLEIAECDGCHVCWEGAECSKADDMNAVYPRIIASDVIVFGTPVYWYGPTALMKAFLDRFVYFNCPANRKKIRGKGAILAAPFEEEDPAAAELLVALFERCIEYLQMKLRGKILAPGVGEKGQILARKDVLAEARELGRTAASA